MLQAWPQFVAEVETLLERHPGGLTEHRLLQALNDKGHFGDWLDPHPSLALFQKHFSLMHCLYRLQPLYQDKGQHLFISPLRIQVFGQDEREAAKSEISAFSDSLRSYYLDWARFCDATPDSVSELLRDFWQRFAAGDQRDEALAVLELDSSASWSEVQAQYRRLAAEHHPDKGGSSARFTEVRTAYETLKKHRGR